VVDMAVATDTDKIQIHSLHGMVRSNSCAIRHFPISRCRRAPQAGSSNWVFSRVEIA
jgi:hypothetical protein